MHALPALPLERVDGLGSVHTVQGTAPQSKALMKHKQVVEPGRERPQGTGGA